MAHYNIIVLYGILVDSFMCKHVAASNSEALYTDRLQSNDGSD